MSSFAILKEALNKCIPLRYFSVEGEELRRIVKITPEADGKERILYWRGSDPDSIEVPVVVEDLVAHLELR